MTVNEYKKQNPGKLFFLKGTAGRIYSFGAVDLLIPEIYESNILDIGAVTCLKVTCLKIDWNFLTGKRDPQTKKEVV